MSWIFGFFCVSFVIGLLMVLWLFVVGIVGLLNMLVLVFCWSVFGSCFVLGDVDLEVVVGLGYCDVEFVVLEGVVFECCVIYFGYCVGLYEVWRCVYY